MRLTQEQVELITGLAPSTIETNIKRGNLILKNGFYDFKNVLEFKKNRRNQREKFNSLSYIRIAQIFHDILKGEELSEISNYYDIPYSGIMELAKGIYTENKINNKSIQNENYIKNVFNQSNS